MKSFALKALLVGAVTLGGMAAWGQDASATQAPADNTKINQRDHNSNSPTADQQKNNPSDIELARQVRKALVNDKSLSTNAHNVKVIVAGGMVTLKGPVNSADEKAAVETKANQVAGAERVNSQLQVVTKETK
jgi:hyperosmotically inducible periplasmic protein